MAIEDVLFAHINTNFTFDGTLYLDSAEGAEDQYITMFKIDDPESRIVPCDVPGEEGQALIRFVSVMGQGVPADGPMVRAYNTTLKNQVKNIRGLIGTTVQYQIWNNETSGVITLDKGRNELNTWQAYFDALLWWSIL